MPSPDLEQREPRLPLDPCPCCRRREFCFTNPNGISTWLCGGCGHERFSGVTWSSGKGMAVIGFYFLQANCAVSLWGLRQYGCAVPKDLNWGEYQAITENMLVQYREATGAPYVCAITGLAFTEIEG